MKSPLKAKIQKSDAKAKARGVCYVDAANGDRKILLQMISNVIHIEGCRYKLCQGRCFTAHDGMIDEKVDCFATSDEPAPNMSSFSSVTNTP